MNTRFYSRIATVFACVGMLMILTIGIHKTGFTAPHSSNLIMNGTFDAGSNFWWSSPGSGVVSGGVYCYTVTTLTANPWEELFGQGNIALEIGETYQLSFDAYTVGGTATGIIANIGQLSTPFTVYGSYTFTASSIPAYHEHSFTMTQPNDSAAQFTFQVGGGQVNTLCVDNVTLIKETPTAIEMHSQATTEKSSLAILIVTSLLVLMTVGVAVVQSKQNS